MCPAHATSASVSPRQFHLVNQRIKNICYDIASATSLDDLDYGTLRTRRTRRTRRHKSSYFPGVHFEVCQINIVHSVIQRRVFRNLPLLLLDRLPKLRQPLNSSPSMTLNNLCLHPSQTLVEHLQAPPTLIPGLPNSARELLYRQECATRLFAREQPRCSRPGHTCRSIWCRCDRCWRSVSIGDLVEEEFGLRDDRAEEC